MFRIKAFVRRILPTPLFHILKDIQRRSLFASADGHSEEEHRTLELLESLPLTNRYCVDIAAQDGVAGSQTLRLFQRGWPGLAVECDARMFAILARMYRGFENVSLIRTRVVPDNVVSILRAVQCPRDFAFLSLDIDSYDYFVLDRLLEEFRPSLACVEINETIPPPLKFTVKSAPDHQWEGDHFQGQSIAQCHELCIRHRYDIVELSYNNLFLTPSELNVRPALTPEAAYDAGYRHMPDRAAKFHWNADMDPLLDMARPQAIEFIRRKFARYEGRYDLE